MPEQFVNQLHFGDNLDRLRNAGVDQQIRPGARIPDEVADLIYLDPPFNSQRQYSLIFKQQKGQPSPAQIMAFTDSWTFSHATYNDFKADERNAPLHKLVANLHEILGTSDMMAYVLMMAPRLLELHRKLKPTGSLYLHCDPVASHYLKIILDVIFGPTNFGNEIIWKRINAKGLAFTRFARNHDVILRYSKDPGRWKWKSVYTAHDPSYVAQFYRHVEEGTGRRYRLDNLANPNKNRPNLTYEFLGVKRVWRWTKDRMEAALEKGLIVQTAPGAVPALKRYLDEQEGTPIGDVWTDIPPVQGASKERRGYPTQKPLALLERIIAASTDEGDVVLDPFAGCGTSIVAAERMNRRWIGIDITYLAINEIVDRLRTEKREGYDLDYELLGTPTDEDAAKALFLSTRDQNHKPFEQWAVTLVRGRWNEARGADRGVDGRIGLWNLKGEYKEGVVQVKGGNSCTLSAVRDFRGVIEREQAVFGIMVCQREPTKEMLIEAESMGFADWPGSRKIPRYQILTTQGVLERGEKPILPESYLIGPDKGVGKAVRDTTEDMFDQDD